MGGRRGAFYDEDDLDDGYDDYDDDYYDEGDEPAQVGPYRPAGPVRSRQ
jgi:hypothetical protein